MVTEGAFGQFLRNFPKSIFRNIFFGFVFRRVVRRVTRWGAQASSVIPSRTTKPLPCGFVDFFNGALPSASSWRSRPDNRPGRATRQRKRRRGGGGPWC